MKLYRVCTQNLNYPDILDYLDKHFPDGYTVIHANGAWQGQREKSLVIEIMGEMDDVMADNLTHLSYFLKKHNGQKAIMIQVIPVVMGMT